MKKPTKIFLALVVAALLSGSLAACNTVEGIGRDARAAGDAITGAAQKTKGY